MKTLFEQLLKTLHVPYTREYTREAYLQHPDRNNLWGISRMLHAYGVENVSILLDDKDKLCQIEAPFLAEFSQDLAIVLKATPDEVQLIWRNEPVKITTTQFKLSWSGVVTLIKKGNAAQEPHYEQHHRQEILKWWCNCMLFLIPLLALVYGWCTQTKVPIWANMVLLALNALGTFISYLLMRQSVRLSNGAIDKVCSLFTKGNCHQVLDSDEASIFGFHWSEIGFSYFFTNLAACCWLPSIATTWMPWILAASLPFTLWSVWTQAFRVRSWCVLCLTILGILWMETLTCLCTGAYSAWPSFSNEWGLTSIYVGTYAFATIATHTALKLWKRSRNVTQLHYLLNRFRSDAAIFEAKLNEATTYEWTTDIRPIVLANGDVGKPTITVVSNPFCQPCSLLHQRLEPLRADGFRIQYILTTFSKSLFEANERIAAYDEKHSPEAMWQLLSEWFAKGRKCPNDFWKKRQISITEGARQRAAAQFNWCQENLINSTPTILINHRLLPDIYDIEDIQKIYSA